jgi:hypothetical protein
LRCGSDRAALNAMDSTTLNLLNRDGIVTVLIVPSLDTDCYSELYDIVCGADTADVLRRLVKVACEKWGRTVNFG